MTRPRHPRRMMTLLATLVLAVGQTSRADELRDSIQQLAECATTECGPSIEALVRSGTISLKATLTDFEKLHSVAVFSFRTRVIPHLPPDEAGPILLDEFRRYEAAFDEFGQLAKRAAGGEPIDDDDPAHADLFRRYRRLRWVAAALGDLEYRPAYDAVYATYATVNELRNGHFELVHGLFGMDPKGALRDFARLLESGNETERLKGATSFRQVARTPSCSILGRLFDDPSEPVRREAYQLIFYTQRECMEMLIHLTANADKQVRDAAEMRLRYVGHMSDAQQQVMMAGADTPERRAALWREWWQDCRELTDAQLREIGCKAALSMAERSLNASLVSFLSGYPEFPEIYGPLTRALSDDDKATQEAGREAIQRLAMQGDSRAVDLLLEHFPSLTGPAAAALVDAISKIKDPRVVPLLLTMLEKAPIDPPTDARNILLALGNTGDARAIEPVLSILLTRTDGTEQYAAMALPRLKGADVVQPKLLERMIAEPNHNTRYALRETIRKIGGATLAKELTRVLPQAGAGNESFEGPQKEVLLLMEEFPDPDAGPQLQDLLRAESRFSRLYAARALAKLGDKSGAAIVLDDLFTPHPMPFHFYAHDVGAALKDIGDPGTHERLERLCVQAEGEQRGRVLQVIAQQEDPTYVPFLGRLIKSEDRPTQCGAAFAISSLIYKTPDSQKQRGLDPTQNAQARVARAMLRWAFRDERPNPDCGAFPDHGLLKEMSGAVVETAKKRYLLYRISDDTLTPLFESKPEDKALIDKAKPRSEDTWAHGELHAEESQGFLSVFLRLDFGGAGYLFQTIDGRWDPVCATGGIIE